MKKKSIILASVGISAAALLGTAGYASAQDGGSPAGTGHGRGVPARHRRGGRAARGHGPGRGRGAFRRPAGGPGRGQPRPERSLKFARTPVSVEVRSEGGVGVVAVDDDGPGIPDADRAPVFERLYVAGHQPPPKESGSGLGLAIVRELVDAMGGEVAAEVSPLGGARLLAPLPLSVSATVPPAGGAAR